MSVLIIETQGDTLVGEIDGVNTDYTVSFDFNPDTVHVYVNGLLKIRDFDDGFIVIPPRTVRMKEPLISGPGVDEIDSLEIEYQSNINSGGGAEGGVPLPPVINESIPSVQTSQEIPGLSAQNVKPSTFADGLNPPVILTKTIRPIILPNDGGDQCQ